MMSRLVMVLLLSLIVAACAPYQPKPTNEPTPSHGGDGGGSGGAGM